MYDLESLRHQMAGGDVFYLLYSDALPLGFSSIRKENDGSWFMNKLYVETTEHRKGMGAYFFKELIAINDIQTIRLQVNRQNYKAINFYFKMGFVIERVADFDIGDGYFMNDFVMVWQS